MARRLRRLEASRGGACPECGLFRGEPFEPDEVLWHDTEGEESAAPEWCPECGEQLAYVVIWSDIGPQHGPGDGGEGVVDG